MLKSTPVITVAAVAGLALAPAASASCRPHHGHQPPHRHVTQYVNLGDSYSAGTGLEPLAAKSPAQCRQAANNYAHVLASKLHYQLTDVSCSGADTSDFFSPQYAGVTKAQLNALSPRTDVVTMVIGGNDGSLFTDVVTTCSQLGYANKGTGSPCKDAKGTTFENTIKKTTYPALVKALRAVRARAPHARVGIVAYPRLMPTSGGCFPQMPIASGDVAYVAGVQATLNDAVKRAARVTGVTYVDAYGASAGHDACKPVGTRWVEPVIGGVTKQPAHPNALGEQALAQLTTARMGLR